MEQHVPRNEYIYSESVSHILIYQKYNLEKYLVSVHVCYVSIFPIYSVNFFFLSFLVKKRILLLLLCQVWLYLHNHITTPCFQFSQKRICVIQTQESCMNVGTLCLFYSSQPYNIGRILKFLIIFQQLPNTNISNISIFP